MNSRANDPQNSYPKPLDTVRGVTNSELLWQEVLRRHQGGLKRRLAGALSRNGLKPVSDLIDDLVQEVFCRLFQRYGTSLTEGPARCELTLAAYLARSADSVVIDRLRYAHATKREARRNLSLSAATAASEAIRCPDPAPTPEQRALASDELWQLVRRLRGSEVERESFRLLAGGELLGLSNRELGERNDPPLPRGTVDTRLHRLRQRLRKIRAQLEARSEIERRQLRRSRADCFEAADNCA